MRTIQILGAAVAMLFSTGTAGAAGAAAAEAGATFHDAEKKEVGSARLKDTPNGLLVQVTLDGVPAGTHALHVHETGECEPPFKSAGGHWNPEKAKHGFLVEKGAHAGDLPNVHVPEDGMLEVEVIASGATIAEMLDDDGAALVVHQGADDYETDPAGDAGDRIACAVIEK